MVRRSAFLLVAVLLLSAVPRAQNRQSEAAAPPGSASLPVKRVVLYKTGVGYFEHLGKVRDDQNISIRFTSAQLNDVLKSLTAIDLGKGQISSVSYGSVAPLEHRLGTLRLPVDGSATPTQLLATLRGARVEVSTAGVAVEGRLLSVEQRPRLVRDNEVTQIDVLSIVTDAGDLRTFEMTPAVRVRILDRDLRTEIGRYLDLVGSTREQDVRTMVISTAGAGERPLFVSYVSEVPVWKSTYRLVLPKEGKPLLQGWAIVDNTIGEDWRNVELSLVAGAPQSFIQQISQPFYQRRPVVPMPSNVLLSPQTHAPTLTRHEAVAAVSESVTVQNLESRATPPAPPPPAAMPFGQTGRVGGRAGTGSGVGPGSGGGTGGGTFRSSIAYDQIQDVQASATGSELGDLFEYRIKEPITLRKNQSALVPIINAGVGAEKVSLWNRGAGSGRPLRALWLTNSTSLTLDGGSISVIDGDAFAGEGLVEPLKPGEKRFISYAADLSLLVSGTTEPGRGRVHRVIARDGILTHEYEERATTMYKVRSEAAAPSILIVEHRARPGWKLSDGQQSLETTPLAHRFRVAVDPGKEATLVVREGNVVASRISIGNVTDDLIVNLVEAGVPEQELHTALKPVVEKRRELALVERRLSDLEAQRVRIVDDQGRLRENMKALRGSSEEKELLQRYTRQLNGQENRLDALQQEIAKATMERDAAQKALAAAVANLRFEITGK